jgi:hypothetical protein
MLGRDISTMDKPVSSKVLREERSSGHKHYQCNFAAEK